MARMPIEKLTQSIASVDAEALRAISSASRLETDSEEFGAVFAKNPAAALAAKGIDISAAEAKGITNQLEALGGPGGNNAKTEISVKVGVKF